MGQEAKLDPEYVEHEPIQPQFHSGVASCDIIDDMIHWVFYTNRPRVIDGRITTEKVLSAVLAIPIKAQVEARLLTNAAMGQNIVELSKRAQFN